MSEGSSSNVLRDFIYIDKDRLNSLYSQLFKGVAESILEAFSNGREDTKKERNLEQNLFEESYKIRNVILFDHIYNSLEDKLAPQLLLVDERTTFDDLKPSSYIKVTGKATIEDFERMIFLLKNFNDTGMALSYMKVHNDSSANDQVRGSVSKNCVEQYAKSNGLVLDKKTTESMAKIIENFHGCTLDVTIDPPSPQLGVFFKATLDEKNMRISANIVRKIYGNKPIMDWTMVGEITSFHPRKDIVGSTYDNIFSEMFSRITEIDSSFEVVSDGQTPIVRIAPIAIYIEHHG